MVRRFLLNTAGAAATEMVLMLPVVLALVFATFEGAYFLWSEHIVIKGVRDGARYGGRSDFNLYTGDCTVDAGLTTNIQELTRTGRLTGGTSRLRDWVNSDVTVECARVTSVQTGLYKSFGTAGAPVVTVSTVFTYQTLFGRFTGFDSTLTLRARAQAAVMGL